VEALRIWGEHYNNTFGIPDTFVIQSREQLEHEARNRGLRVVVEDEGKDEEDDV
jgi:fructose-specific phosphotransferase system component IIB